MQKVLVGPARLLFAAALALALVSLSLVMSEAPRVRAAVGGPVILGGDDLTDHGGASGGVNHTGWLYIEKALGSIAPQVTRSGSDGSVAALGSEPGLAGR